MHLDEQNRWYIHTFCTSMSPIADTFTLFKAFSLKPLIFHCTFALFSITSKTLIFVWVFDFWSKIAFSKRWYCRTFFAPRSPKYGYIRIFLYHFFIHQQNRAKSLIHSHFSQGLQISIIENEQKRWYIRVFWWGSYFLTTSLAVCEEREKTQAESSVLKTDTHFCWAPLQPNARLGKFGLSRRRNPRYTCAASPLWWFCFCFYPKETLSESC